MNCRDERGSFNWRIVPTSCRCGGSWAWVRDYGGVQVMHGCVCHHTPGEILSLIGAEQVRSHLEGG